MQRLIYITLLLLFLWLARDVQAEEFSYFETKMVMTSKNLVGLRQKNDFLKKMRRYRKSCKLEIEQKYVPKHCYVTLELLKIFKEPFFSRAELDFLCQKALLSYRDYFVVKNFLTEVAISPTCQSYIKVKLEELRYQLLDRAPKQIISDSV